jgi:hypothetical protein
LSVAVVLSMAGFAPAAVAAGAQAISHDRSVAVTAAKKAAVAQVAALPA